MRPIATIAVIASDEGLRDSLRFALGVEGFAVISSGGWEKDMGLDADLLCIIVDSVVFRQNHILRESLKGIKAPIIFLSDDLPPLPDYPRLTQLSKPLKGSDLLDAVRGIAA